MDRRAVHRGKSRGDLHRADRVRRLERPHRYYHGTGERPGRRAGDIGAIHWYPNVALDVADRQIVRHQRLLERERASKHKGNQVVAPMLPDIGRFFHHLAVAPDTVPRQIGTNIEIGPERGDARVSNVGHADHGARLRVELTKPVKRRCELFGQDRKIALNKTVCDASRAAGHSGAASQPRLQARQHLPFRAFVFLRQTENHR